ncbi:MAG: hypothetical protein IT370_23180 [Deltaproteobacteria bacterium]|nr:hypothetical protein [Deltaproteobacteria bacterium]
MVLLTPKRPHLSLRAPRARAGALLEATLFVDAERTVTVDRFIFELHGQERARAGDRADVRELCRLMAAAALALASGGAPCRLENERGALVLTVDAIVASAHQLEARLSALCDLAEQPTGSGRPYR